ncbi:MAG: hypothetical protein IPL96_11825 [Holophagaceae bacterium]|nr:hypothetical protein [Holophagaceae bacterium]
MILFLPPAVQVQAPVGAIRAQYAWGYVGADCEGKGTLNLLVDAATGAVVLELQGLGERLMLLQGDGATGYRLQIPRQKLDTTSASLAELPLPFLPKLGGPAALRALVAEGRGPGVKVTKRDAAGPVKLKYQGKDDQGKEVLVWLERKRWQPAVPAAAP